MLCDLLELRKRLVCVSNVFLLAKNAFDNAGFTKLRRSGSDLLNFRQRCRKPTARQFFRSRSCFGFGLFFVSASRRRFWFVSRLRFASPLRVRFASPLRVAAWVRFASPLRAAASRMRPSRRSQSFLRTKKKPASKRQRATKAKSRISTQDQHAAAEHAPPDNATTAKPTRQTEHPPQAPTETATQTTKKQSPTQKATPRHATTARKHDDEHPKAKPQPATPPQTRKKAEHPAPATHAENTQQTTGKQHQHRTQTRHQAPAARQQSNNASKDGQRKKTQKQTQQNTSAEKKHTQHEPRQRQKNAARGTQTPANATRAADAREKADTPTPITKAF